MDIKTLRKKVEYILQREELSRNDDDFLIVRLWEILYEQDMTELGLNAADIYYLFKRVPKADDITRWRQKIQAEGLYLPTDPEIVGQRKLNEKRWRQDLGYPN